MVVGRRLCRWRQVFGNNLGVNELKPVFDTAMDGGLNLWDSAVVYGMGASESVLAAFTKERNREDVLISTKFTPQIAGDFANPVEDMLNSSLERFGTDYIDIYWIHNPADVEKWTPFLIDLVKSGKVKRVGVSNHNLAQIKRAEEILSKEGVHISCRYRTTSASFTVHQRKPASLTIARKTASTSGHTWYWSRVR